MSTCVWSAVGLVVAAAVMVGLWQTTGGAEAAGADRPAVGAVPTSVIGSAPHGGSDFVPAWSAWSWLSSRRVTPIDWFKVTSCVLQPSGCFYLTVMYMDVCLIVENGDRECITGVFD